jgi:hypothetical protein
MPVIRLLLFWDEFVCPKQPNRASQKYDEPSAAVRKRKIGEIRQNWKAVLQNCAASPAFAHFFQSQKTGKKGVS